MGDFGKRMGVVTEVASNAMGCRDLMKKKQKPSGLLFEAPSVSKVTLLLVRLASMVRCAGTAIQELGINVS